MTNNKMVFAAEVLYTKTSKKTGNEYKKWEFVGWSYLPETWVALPHQIKGEWLHIVRNNQLERYHVGKEWEMGVIHE
jgi:hypothetical protein